MHFHFLLSFYWCTWPLTNKVDHMYYISIFLEENPQTFYTDSVIYLITLRHAQLC